MIECRRLAPRFSFNLSPFVRKAGGEGAASPHEQPIAANVAEILEA